MGWGRDLTALWGNCFAWVGGRGRDLGDRGMGGRGMGEGWGFVGMVWGLGGGFAPPTPHPCKATSPNPIEWFDVSLNL